MKRTWHPLFLLFLAVATFGFFYKLFTDTAQFFYNTLLFVLAGLVFYAIYRYIIRNPKVPRSHHHQRQYTKGQHALKKIPSFKQSTTQNKPTLKKKRAKDHPFTVIEGNKGKKKNPFSS